MKQRKGKIRIPFENDKTITDEITKTMRRLNRTKLTNPEPHCALCDTPLNDGNDSKEHIILNAIGGRKTVRNFICMQCNSRTGEKWDKELVAQLRPICTLLDIKRRHGDNQPVPVETVGGEQLLLYPDRSMAQLKPTFSERNLGHATEINIGVRSIQDVKKMLPGLKRKYPNLDIEEVLKKAIPTQEYLQEPFHFSLEFGGDLAERSIIKSCLALAYQTGLGIKDCEHAEEYLLGNGEQRFGYYNETDVVRNRPENVFFHCIFVCGDPESRQVLAYAEYFGCYRVVACLSSSYDGPRFSRCYAIDPLAGKELDLDVHLDFTPEDITAIYADEKVSWDNTQMALESLLETWKEKDTKASIADAVEDAIEFALANCGVPPEEELSEEDVANITHLLLERLEPFMLHLLSSRTFSEDELRDIELKMRKPDQDGKDEGG